MTSSNVTWHAGEVSRSARAELLGGSGATLWLTGLSGSGKSTLAAAVEQMLVGAGTASYRLDGDNLRTGLNGDLGFSRTGREENCRRVAEVARLFADAGLIAIVAVISPYASSRRQAREIHEQAGLPFIEVYLAATAAHCAQRDPKGLYADATAGRIEGFTGIDDPYEVPDAPDLVIGADLSVEEAARLVIGSLAPVRR